MNYLLVSLSAVGFELSLLLICEAKSLKKLSCTAHAGLYRRSYEFEICVSILLLTTQKSRFYPTATCSPETLRVLYRAEILQQPSAIRENLI